MIRELAPALAVLALSSLAAAQPKEAPEPPATLFGEIGRHRHRITTTSPEAQKFFDQGMTLYYGFNHLEAVRSFRQAAELDPKAAMPHWGIGIALGPNYNRDIDPVGPERNRQAFDAVQRALKLSEDGPKHERSYIAALARRYSIDPKADGRKLEVDYRDAMADIVKLSPDDLDAAVLYAEAILNLRPWDLWDEAGEPKEGVAKAVRTLESVLRRDPGHIGANHYYIHALEASLTPERALPSAHRLLTATPWAGHLVHMPGHIFIHTGDYDLAARANEDAIRADEEYLKLGRTNDLYRMMYFNHNWQFLVYARMAEGRFDEARKAADRLAELVAPEIEHMPPMQGFAQEPLKVLLRFHRYDEILKTPAPRPKHLLSRTFWHYARAVAFSAKGDRDQAKKAAESFEITRQEIPADFPFGVNPASGVLDVAREVMAARLADDPKVAITHWRKAVELEQALKYGEPPDWYYPVRESLGATLLRDGQAALAEQVFREDLQRHRRNGRSLFGLSEALKAQGKTHEAALVRQQFEQTWKSTEPLDLDRY